MKTVASNKVELTPMMKQFFDLKQQHPDAILLFRCGDFYETYHDDAKDANRILGITLTNRNNSGSSEATPMAGFPHHALDIYLPKLVRAGRRVAICDQLEDPKKTKKLVKRGITELVTPGVAMTEGVLSNKENNFLTAVHFGKGSCGVAFLDISTGEFLTGEGTIDYVEKLLANFLPKEVLYDRSHRAEFGRHFGSRLCVYEMDDWAFTEHTAREKLLRHFGVRSLKGFGVDHLKSGVVAAGAVMHYLDITQHTSVSHIDSIARIEEERYVRLDKFTIRSLELLQPMHDEGTSLLDVIDRTVTPMGARLLRRWVVFPLKEERPIQQRLDVVEHFFRQPQFRALVDEQFRKIGDLERIVSKAAVGRISPREVVQLKNALTALVSVKHACQQSDNESLRRIGEGLDLCEPLRQRIEQQIDPEPPALLNRGNVIRRGFSQELDKLRDIATGGRDYLLAMRQKEAERTGISSLKIGFNNVFGYYLEVRNTYKSQVPPEWIRKQTLAQAERYITQELKEYEDKITGADDKIQAMEEQLFNQLVHDMQEYIVPIKANASLVARLDCLLSFAAAAEEHHYVRPQIDTSLVIDIKQGRHPVIETQMPPGESYIPNDVLLDHDTQQIIIITGPNMAGKSALLRQTALIVLLAQVGSFVPAEAARIGMVDKIFTRVGASDNLSMGESTFMVEMTEAANILNNVSNRSLVLFDELGRGTSTYDGISIAWAIVEYLHQREQMQARTLFATHYHELNEMEKHFPRIKNYNVSVKDVDGQVIFLRRLVRGGSEHSFGIHVAELAGMPSRIVRRAGSVLRQLEREASSVGAAGKDQSLRPPVEPTTQLSFFQLDDPVLAQVRDEIIGLDINNLTPMEALNKLHEIKKIILP